MIHRLRLIALALCLLLALAGCTDGAVGDATTAPTTPAGVVLPELKIAFVEDLSRDGAAQRVAPAFQGARLSVDSAVLDGLRAAVDVVPLDTKGTPVGIRDVAEEIVGDRSFVAAIVAPQLSGQIALGDRLDAAGVATISLSTLGPDLPEQGWAYWRRAVPDVERVARALVGTLGELSGPHGACLLGDGSPASVALLRGVVRALGPPPVLRMGLADVNPDDPSVLSAIGHAGCRSIVWGGSPAGAALLRLALVEADMRSVRMFGGESLKDASFVTESGPRGRGTFAVCPCVDLSTSTDLRARRFIQDYQSAFGVPPGPFAAEAWDVARMVLDPVRAGATTRGEVAEALRRTRAVDGLARTYVFARNGVLRDQAAAVRVYRDEGVRWVAVSAPRRG